MRSWVCLKTNNFGKYLGFPLKHKGAMKGLFLSFAGRMVLVKSVILAVRF